MAGPATTYLVLDIVTAAYQKLNTIDETQAPSAEQGVVALATLNDLMADWAANGVDVGWFPQTSLSATAPLEASDARCIKLSLAIELAAHYGIRPGAALAVEQDEAYAALAKRYQRYAESSSELPREQAIIDRTGQNL